MAAGYALGPVLQIDQASRRTVLLRLGTGHHRRLHPPAREQPLRRSRRLEHPGHLARHRALLRQLREVSAVPALPDDDLGAGADPARRRSRARAGTLPAGSPRSGACRSSTTLAHIYLIHAARGDLRLQRSSATRRGCSAAFRAQKPAGYGLRLPIVYAVWLGGGRRALSGLPVVCRSSAGASGGGAICRTGASLPKREAAGTRRRLSSFAARDTSCR